MTCEAVVSRIAGGLVMLVFLAGCQVRGPDSPVPAPGTGQGIKGRLEPNAVSTLRPDPNLPTRQVVALLVRNGDRVRAGQVVARIDPSGLDLDLESARSYLESQESKLTTLEKSPLPQDLAQAQAGLVQAQLDCAAQKNTEDRSRPLADQGLISLQQWEDIQRATQISVSRESAALALFDAIRAGSRPEDLQAQRSAVASARSSFLRAQLILGSTTVKSPVDGIVSEILVNVGDMASAATAVATVSNSDPMLVRCSVDESLAPSVKAGQKAVVTVDPFPGQPVEGTVTEVDYRASTQDGAQGFTTLVAIPNAGGRYLWGMSATVNLGPRS